MADVTVAGSVIPSTVNTPLDKRSVVATLTDVSSIGNPVLGAIFFCTETGKHYRITALKSKIIGPATVANAAVDTYEEFGTGHFYAGSGLQLTGGTFSLNLGGGTSGQCLCLGSDGSSFVWNTPVTGGSSPTRLTDLTDVSADNLTAGYVLRWNGSNWQAQDMTVLGPAGISSIASGAATSRIYRTSLAELADVSAVGVTSGDILRYNGNNWQTQSMPDLGTDRISSIAGGAATSRIHLTSLTELADVSETGVTSGGILCYDGTSWQATQFSAGTGLQFAGGTFSLNLGGGISGQCLCLDSDGSSFLWGTPVGGGSALIRLTDLADVSSSGITSGGILCYDGTSWKATQFSAGPGLQLADGTFSLNPGSGISGQCLCIGSDGSSFVWNDRTSNSSSIRLTDLSDVSSDSLEEGYALCWTGNGWQAQNVAGLGPDGIAAVASGAAEDKISLTSLTELADVSSGNLEAGYALCWNGSGWQAQNVSGLNSAGISAIAGGAAESKISLTSLTELADVSSDGVTSGGVLCYDGTSWQTSQFSACQRNQQIQIGSGRTVSDFTGLSSRAIQAESTLAVFTDDEYPGSGTVVFQGGEIELRWDEAHQSAGRQVLIHHPLIFSGCRKVKLEGIQIRAAGDNTKAIVMSDGGLLRMNRITCENCNQAVTADMGAFVYLENENCFGSGVTKGIVLEKGASALTKENEMLNLAVSSAFPGYGSMGYELNSNGTVCNSSALTDNGIILRTPDNGSMISANFMMSGITLSSGSRISIGPHADGRDLQIISGGNIRLHLGNRTDITGNSGGSALNITSGIWSGFSGNISALIVGSGAVVHHFSGSADVKVEESGTFSSSVLTGGSLTVCSGGIIEDVTLGDEVTSTHL